VPDWACEQQNDQDGGRNFEANNSFQQAVTSLLSRLEQDLRSDQRARTSAAKYRMS
jgi:hypothetical protein